jgi:hypothetical protein
MSWYSDGFPLAKAQAYAALTRPFLVNDLDKQVCGCVCGGGGRLGGVSWQEECVNVMATFVTVDCVYVLVFRLDPRRHMLMLP